MLTGRVDSIALTRDIRQLAMVTISIDGGRRVGLLQTPGGWPRLRALAHEPAPAWRIRS
jgi:hypothetical protein